MPTNGLILQTLRDLFYPLGMELMDCLLFMKKSSLTTNTGYRFISKNRNTFKIHIHTPDDKTLFRTIGFVRIGESKGLKKAIKLRNELGKDMWGKFWRRLLNDPYLLTRLPHSIEPVIIQKPSPTQANPDNRDAYYLASWRELDENGESKCRSKVCSINKYGKKMAYKITKKAMLKGHKQNIEILIHMGRLKSSDVK